MHRARLNEAAVNLGRQTATNFGIGFGIGLGIGIGIGFGFGFGISFGIGIDMGLAVGYQEGVEGWHASHQVDRVVQLTFDGRF